MRSAKRVSNFTNCSTLETTSASTDICFARALANCSIHVEETHVLSKDLLPLPEKWHGLTDVELRYRQRYVDLVMNPKSREVFLKRSKLVQSLRRFLDSHGFVEVETPMMQSVAGGAVARPFVTHHNTLDIDLFLRIAPELYLKRLLVGGFDRVYEINRNFRNEGISTRHNPEFTMVEFYQAYTDYRGVMDLTQQLIEQAAKDVTGGTKTKWGEEEIDWASPNWRRMTMREAIIHYWPEAAGGKPELADFVTHDSVSSLVMRFNTGHAHAAYNANEPAGKSIADLFEAAAEEHLTQPTIIYEFPTAVSPLSKQKADEPDWTERWEIYAGTDGDCQRIQRTQRSRRAAPSLRTATRSSRARRRRSSPDGRGLHPCTVVWHASGWRRGGWRGSARHVVYRFAQHPRCDFISPCCGPKK